MEAFCSKSVACIVFHKLREYLFLRKGKTLKTVTSQEISIFGTKEENPRYFCFASNHTQKKMGTPLSVFSAAGLGFSYGVPFIELLTPLGVWLSVLTVNGVTWANTHLYQT